MTKEEILKEFSDCPRLDTLSKMLDELLKGHETVTEFADRCKECGKLKRDKELEQTVATSFIFGTAFGFASNYDEKDKIFENIREIIDEKGLCADTISRKAAIDCVMYGSMSPYQIADAISALPSVTPQRWIPVSERLPEPYNDLLLTICANSAYYGFNKNFAKVKCGQYQPQDDKRDWFVDGVRYYFDNVIAWMPLPERYKAESEGSDEDSD